LSASVLVNGFTTAKFNIEQSVKQGDALSCSLFVLAIEPLLRKIQNNTNITPVTIKLTENGSMKEISITTISYADDITCVFQNSDGIQAIIDDYNAFSSYSGIKLNIDKTEIMILGKKSNTDEEIFDIYVKGKQIKLREQSSVCICGITYSNNKQIAYQNNIIDKIAKLEKHLNIWKMRNLTLEGKILIVKTFGLSQILYSLQSTSIEDKDIKFIENVIFRFIWNVRQDNKNVIGKISRSIMKQPKENGGLCAPDVESLVNAIAIKSMLKSYTSSHPVSAIYQSKLTKLGFNLQNLSTIYNSFDYLGRAVKAIVNFRITLEKDIKVLSSQDDGIHKNYFAVVQNFVLLQQKCFNVNQQFMLSRLKRFNINTVSELLEEKTLKRFPQIALDVHQISNSIPKEWITLLTKTRRSHALIGKELPIELNKWKDISVITLKEVKNMTMRHIEINSVNIINRKHDLDNVNMTSNPFATLFTSIKDIKLRNIQYKIMHNIYPTLKHLFKWKLHPSGMCAHCGSFETLKHAIFECPIALDAIKKLEYLINKRYNVPLNFTYENILLGTCSTITNYYLDTMHRKAIDTLLILLKQKLILQREHKTKLETKDIENMIMSRINIELYGAKSFMEGSIANRKTMLVKRWNLTNLDVHGNVPSPPT
jgi:hypothetical protein